MALANFPTRRDKLLKFWEASEILGRGKKDMMKELEDKLKLGFIDFVHAFVSLLVFMIFALSDSNVQSCFFPEAGGNENAVIMNLPLGAGVLSSFLFTKFPTKRRGIGYADMSTRG
ncbi:protein DMP4 [Fagus crenata]